MTSAGNASDTVAALFTASFLHIPEFVGHHAVQYLSNQMDSFAQAIPVSFVYVLLITAPLFIGLLRVVWPLLESCILSSSASVGGIPGRLSYIQRNIIVQLSPLFFVEVPNYNILLQNAVMVYVCHHLWRQTPLPSRLHCSRAQTVDLVDPYRTWQANVKPHLPFCTGTPLRYHWSQEEFTQKELDRLRLLKLPINSWAPVMAEELEIYFHEEPLTLANYSSNWTRRTLSLRCPATPGAAARLDAFVQRALEVFAEGAPGKEEDDGARWFFAYGGESDDKVYFNQYVLRSNKGFDTLFFPQRDATLTLVDQFAQRRGRFAVEGFPQRLGFLVYGPPGTGRHAFVKALAAYTGRHVVSVPLSKLRTNQQLYDIFFVREFQSEEGGSVQKLRMEDVIFLFDDVDAANPVVCARDGSRVVQRRAAARLTARAGLRDAPLTTCVIEMDTSSSRPVVRTEDSALPLALLMEIMGGGASKDGGGGSKSEGGSRRRTEKRAAVTAGDAGAGVVGGNLFEINGMLFGENKDRLDLAGLLNVLDGVLDAPGRMVVMITEHPEWLDPALVRPGRFSVRLRLDYMEMEALVQMLGLYYGDVEHSPRGIGAGAGAVGADAGSGVGAARAAQCPAVGAAGRAVHRELSEAQVARVRGAVAALEEEAEAAAAREVDTDGSGERKYCFQVTPCEVEMLCMGQDDLEGFLTQLAGVVRGTGQL
ncbi:nucleoside triphosphate hydrolase, putative [Leishmania panamensis]|uniref:Nucleoside triphosphate hydrolase, putative n=1 Tax=Leishmania panamensis TaxID=5679 RepID=A0AC62A501_LEIPA